VNCSKFYLQGNWRVSSRIKSWDL